MFAARAYRDEALLRLEDIEVPSIDDTEVLIRNRASGINRGTISLWRSSKFMPLLPTILGYEIAGEVAAVGASVRGYSIGQRVLVHSFLSCGQCDYCRSGESADCPAAANMGHIAYGPAGMALYERYHNGGLAEYVRVPAVSLEPLPDSISFDAAARIPSLGVAYRALSRLGAPRGATIAINGISGAFGAAAAMLAPLFGIARVIGIVRSEKSLTRVRPLLPAATEFTTFAELGEDWAQSGSLGKRLRQLSDNAGLDGALDFSPSGSVAAVQTLQGLRKGGTMVCIAGNLQTIEFPYILLMQNSLTIRGSRGATRQNTRELLQLVKAARFDPIALVSHRFSLSSVNDALVAIEQRTDLPLMVAVDPN